MKYDVKSLKAEEFINHEEILETIRINGLIADEIIADLFHLAQFF